MQVAASNQFMQTFKYDTVRKALGSETDTGSAQHETENKPMCSGRIVVGKWREKLGV